MVLNKVYNLKLITMNVISQCNLRMCQNPGLTVQVLSSMARTKAVDSMVQERTVSVRPSRNMRVIEDSYVRQNSPLSCSKGNT